MNVSYYTARPTVWGFAQLTSTNLDDAVDYINSSENVSVAAVRSGSSVSWTNVSGSAQTATINDWLQGIYGAGQSFPSYVNKQSPDQAFQNGIADLQAIGSPVVSYELDES